MNIRRILSLAAAIHVALAVSASAAVLEFNAVLDSGQQVPPNVSTATGSAKLLVDDVNETFTFSMSVNGIDFGDLIDVGPGAGPVHLHNGPFGGNGPVIVPFSFPGGGYTDTADGFDLFKGMADYASNNTALLSFTEFVDELKAGNIYINVHTAAYENGEIRGQVSPVPLPASALFLLAGLGGMLGLRARKS